MKTLTAVVASASAAEQADVILFCELDFASGFVRINSTESDVSWDGKSWLGAGRVAALAGVEESDELEAVGFSGVLDAGVHAALALGEKFRGRPAKLWLGFRDVSSGALFADPVLLAAARIDKLPIKLGASGRVLIECVNRIADWQRVNAARFTDAEQKARYPDDRGFEQVSQTNEREIPWGPTS